MSRNIDEGLCTEGVAQIRYRAGKKAVDAGGTQWPINHAKRIIEPPHTVSLEEGNI